MGSSTNILVISVAVEMGMSEFGIFDFALPAVLVGFPGLLYLWLIAAKLLPAREMALSDESARLFTAQLFMSDQNLYLGLPLADLIALIRGEMNVRRIRRTENVSIVPLPDVRI